MLEAFLNSDVLQPDGQCRAVLADAAWPQPVDEHARAVVGSRFIDPLEL